MEEASCRGLLRHTLANGALVYPSHGGRYHAKDCKALGSRTDAPVDLNGLVRFGERRDLVSARVPSRFKRTLTVVS